MPKYCNGCKRDLEIDNFYSYKKSICKQCVNKKVKCHYCNKEFNSTNLSKHTKQIHSTYNTSNTNDSTYNTSKTSDSTYNTSNTNDSTYNTSSTNDSTSKKTNKNNSTSKKTNKSTIIDENNEPLYPTVEDSLYLNKYIELKKDKIYDIKTRDQINRILTKNRMLHDKIKNNTITKREEKQYENNLNKLKDLDYFDERFCKILLKYKYLD